MGLYAFYYPQTEENKMIRMFKQNSGKYQKTGSYMDYILIIYILMLELKKSTHEM